MSPPTLAVLAAGCASDPVSRALFADGEITWTATFDEAAGLEDCTYTRHYSGMQDRSTPWLCRGCDTLMVAEVATDEPARACYRSFAGVDPVAEERIGWSEDAFWRTTWPFGPLAEGGRAEHRADTVTVDADPVEIELPEGMLTLEAHGELHLSSAPGDPWQGMLPPDEYACGWPRSEEPLWPGPWNVEVGGTLPDGWFGDPCGEPVRLHDFEGKYLVVTASAMDCGPCQAMAEEEAAFVADLRSRGVPFESITLLAPSLEAPVDPIPQGDLELWTDVFGLHSPVLGDRGWGYAMGADLWPDGMAYPAWFVTAPDLEVLAVGRGYDGWQGAESAITTHRNP